MTAARPPAAAVARTQPSKVSVSRPISEAVGLDVDDARLSARKGVLRILGKGEKVREVPIHTQLRRDLTLWLEERPGWPGADVTPALFLNQRGGRLSVRGARDVVATLADAASQEDETTAHVLRHTFVPRSSGAAPTWSWSPS
jgi:site-specific recombinase XerD